MPVNHMKPHRNRLKQGVARKQPVNNNIYIILFCLALRFILPRIFSICAKYASPKKYVTCSKRFILTFYRNMFYIILYYYELVVCKLLLKTVHFFFVVGDHDNNSFLSPWIHSWIFCFSIRKTTDPLNCSHIFCNNIITMYISILLYKLKHNILYLIDLHRKLLWFEIEFVNFYVPCMYLVW